MIRRIPGAALPPERDTECSARIHGLQYAYGETDLVQFYSDERSSCLALLDGVAFWDTPGDTTEEWRSFLRLLPGLSVLRTDRVTGKQLSVGSKLPCSTGKLMRFTGQTPSKGNAETSCRLPELYSLLQSSFPTLPPLDSWYVDVSHRVRHGFCHLSVIDREDIPVSAAMTVAETQQAAVIGAVVTAPDHRGQGLAIQCVTDLLAQLADKRSIWIAPIDAAAERLYARLEFTVQDSSGWAELIYQ